MSTATEGTLNGLHELLAQVLVAQVGHKITMYNEETEEDDVIFTVTPATLAIAAKFLKDNEITTTITNDANLTELQDILAKKQKHGRTTLATVTKIEAKA